MGRRLTTVVLLHGGYFHLCGIHVVRLYLSEVSSYQPETFWDLFVDKAEQVGSLDHNFVITYGYFLIDSHYSGGSQVEKRSGFTGHAMTLEQSLFILT
jgi:hypothetical protein